VAGTQFVAGERSPVIAMAGGPAFTFGYAEHRELLTAAGAQVAVFDPLHDPLPADAAGLVLPGGFPEEHAEALAANTVLRAAVAEVRFCQGKDLMWYGLRALEGLGRIAALLDELR